MSSSAALTANPFSQWKSTTNLDPKVVVASNLPDELATLIFSKMAIEQVQVIMENSKTQMDRYSLYRNLVSAKSSLTGTELGKFQLLLSMEGQTLIAGGAPALKPWADLLKDHPMSLGNLKYFDLSDSTNIADVDLIALTKGCKNLTTLILPGAFPSEEVMAVLRTNCPQAAIYSTAMTEHEWAHPAEFMTKLPPPPEVIKEFICFCGSRPPWRGITREDAHMVMPKVNKIVRNIDGRSVMMPWTLDNVSKLDKATGGVGCRQIWHEILLPANDKPSEVGFEWIVFTKDVLPQSRNQTYDQQKQLAEHWGYEVPGFLDATTCMLWENRILGNRIYHDNPWTYTRCKERIGDSQLIAGGFAPSGVCVSNSYLDVNDIGVGGLRKFKVIKHGDL